MAAAPPRIAPARRPLGAGAAVLLLTLATGCAGEAQPPPVLSGRVLYGGAPLTEGRVTLLGPRDQVVGATIAKDGTYRFENPPVGRARLAVAVYDKRPVHAPPPGSERPEDRPALAVTAVPAVPVVRIPDRYGDPGTSGLTHTVEAGDRTRDIELSLLPGDPPAVRPEDVPPVGVEVGRAAPEIDGEDLEGRRFRLSEFRGKVTVVMFYGHWCSLSRADFGQARAMADQYRDRPFALVGMNTDDHRSTGLARDQAGGYPWRSWWAGSVLGPVCDAWRVPGLPYYVVLDARGVVRSREAVGEGLGKLVADLMDQQR